jgi:hypothetical protein
VTVTPRDAEGDPGAAAAPWAVLCQDHGLVAVAADMPMARRFAGSHVETLHAGPAPAADVETPADREPPADVETPADEEAAADPAGPDLPAGPQTWAQPAAEAGPVTEAGVEAAAGAVPAAGQPMTEPPAVHAAEEPRRPEDGHEPGAEPGPRPEADAGLDLIWDLLGQQPEQRRQGTFRQKVRRARDWLTEDDGGPR